MLENCDRHVLQHLEEYNIDLNHLKGDYTSIKKTTNKHSFSKITIFLKNF